MSERKTIYASFLFLYGAWWFNGVWIYGLFYLCLCRKIFGMDKLKTFLGYLVYTITITIGCFLFWYALAYFVTMVKFYEALVEILSFL